MRIRAVAFTVKGNALLDTLEQNRKDWCLERRTDADLKDWTRDSFLKGYPMLFVGATGIAIRMISDFVKDKLTDSPVLVMDEGGRFVIPLLSGHMGGANALAYEIAQSLGAIPVITTATDVEKTFAVDVFARKNGLGVVNRDGIQKVSKKVLEGGKLTISIETGIPFEREKMPKELKLVPYPPKGQVDILVADEDDTGCGTIHLYPKNLVLGMGCRKGKSREELEAFVLEILHEDIWRKVFCLASVDVKREEQGLVELAMKNKLPFLTYSAEKLEQVEGSFCDSSFVKDTVGVANVCERAARLAAGKEGRLLVRKQASNGMTLAVAFRPARISTWEMDYE